MPRKPDFDILFNDADIVAVQKPGGLAAIAGRAEPTNLLEGVARQLGLPYSGTADPRLRVVHRLDKDTTGVMLFAKHVGAQRHLSHQFQNNTVEKEYLALISGSIINDKGEIDAPILPHPTDKLRMAVDRHGRRAVTAWKVEQRMRRFTLVRAFPKTGKTHQIRVHFAHIGHPLAIDPLYGPDQPIMLSEHKRGYRPPSGGEEERPLIARLTLHAHRITFDHPTAGRMTIEATPPKDFRAALRQLK